MSPSTNKEEVKKTEKYTYDDEDDTDSYHSDTSFVSNIPSIQGKDFDFGALMFCYLTTLILNNNDSIIRYYLFEPQQTKK